MASLFACFKRQRSEPDAVGKAALVDQMRGRFVDSVVDDVTLRGFLAARSWNASEATTMLQEHLKWRAENLPLPAEEAQPILESGALACLVSGGNQRPLLVVGLEQLSRVDWNVAGVMRRHLRAVAHCADMAVASMSDGVETWNFIIDCTGARSLPISFIQELTILMQAHYPERDNEIIVYPLPSFIQPLIAMLPERARGKLSFISTCDALCDKVGFSRAQLPERMWGPAGNLTAAYLFHISSRGALEQWYTLAAGEKLKWAFKVVENMVDFELRYRISKDGAQGKASIIKKVRKTYEEEGGYTAKYPGAVGLIFYNTCGTSSYWRGRSIFVSHEMVAKVAVVEE
mmetsp:Transcript_119746/g.344096  ORF Transcript_119746/g.344096 Transcript_119746/m.344096 type:complete len:345 (-) Transcript_119746:479-1513(-)